MKDMRFQLPDDMKVALVEMSRKSGRPQSDIVRHAIAKYLEYETGHRYDWRLEWGGARESDNGRAGG